MLPIIYVVSICIAIILIPGSALDVAFSSGSGDDAVGIESNYVLSQDSSVSEEATLDAESNILEDSRTVSVSGNGAASQTCFGSGGYAGIATMNAIGAHGQLSGYAYLTPGGMHSTQSAALSGSSASAGMTLSHQGASATVAGEVTDGILHSDLSSWTGSANLAGYFSASGDGVLVSGSTAQGEDWGRLTSTASALGWAAANFNGWIFASASSQDGATHITQNGELSGGFYRASGQAMSSGIDSELWKSRGAYDGTFGTTVNVWTDDFGRYITGLGNHWFVKCGESIQYVLDQASEGDEVELDSCTFTENIAVDKFLNIYGQGIDVTTISARDIGTPVIDITGS